ncbi:MAG: MraY family glycosyltransferase [Flavobacteriaceae bacterium]
MNTEVILLEILFLTIGFSGSYFLNGYLYVTFKQNKMYDPIVSRSSHREKATRSGGMALFFTFCICYGLGKAVYSMSIDLYALISFIFIALTGMADDFFSIKYREKFFLQVFAAIVLIQSGIYINSFHGIFGIFEIPVWASYIISVFVFIVIVNAFNLIDGIDGLSALLSIKFFVLIGALITITSNDMYLVIPSVIGAITGFLFFNFNPAKKVFLGDTGALLLGSIIAFFVFYILDNDTYVITDDLISRPLMIILLIIYPLTDTLRASIIRMYKGRSPFVADRVHLHHRLIDKGMSHWGASLSILIMSISIIFLGFVFSSFFSLALSCLLIFFYMIGLFYLFFN